MIPFPDISPNLFSVNLFGFDIALRWYALAYIAGILIGWWIVLRAIRNPSLWSGQPPATAEQVERLLTWIVLGVILGGRIGYVLFYDLPTYLADPIQILKVWEGGMSFHGGFAGVVIASILFCRRERIPLLSMGDLLAVATPTGLMLGRIANFINAELWGRPTNLPWGVIFPGTAAQTCPEVVGICARHPSQLYQAALEGLLLALVLLWLAFRRGWFKRPGALMGVFLVGYGIARFVVEFVRQPDVQFVSPGNPIGWAVQAGDFGLTMGQLLSLPMIAAGVWFVLRAKAR
ncbi:prolipoprotein diacylglyceryl transferase [Tabrizicola sp.]|jgi:phosphatidylglycerol---prolipoprotein diacylglyceryl transferase|uniref:prolipoprotein diacylglyceryl transferase n=2 Tax=Pseudomonadota TaxID=1224 RepID=UPI000BD2C706|nr:prolipoprotein diacylglyceryl transferase [Tabrizicola sp.]MBY0352417.1 prolipoprotein diacylglyceryl transferase [Tabrizicola sp.]MDK2773588.1 prolipoprotein diacylglyceryl transferase [Tabrizicola sp.]OYX20294.1 MAG: prolipoprotein diacylglyceryl transferase [Rhodobacterales bacterium 32-66-9]